MNTIFESVSALQRFKSRNALQVSSPNHASSYILMCKIKKILNKEFTEEVWKRYHEEHGFSEKSRMDRAGRITHFLMRLERLEAIHMKVILAEYDENGIWGMVQLLSLPVAKLMKIARRGDEKEERSEVY